jgi:uncharacterized repeat protein (TIGR03803 family)
MLLTIGITSMMLAACGGIQEPIMANAGSSQRASTLDSYRVLYSFRARSDGEVPRAGLTDMDGILYGTTYQGGKYNEGTVFHVTTLGKENVLYSFEGTTSNDGANPSAAVLAVKGALYGTTEYGGIPSDGGCNAGTVFRISRGGKENVIYRFYGYNCHDQIYYDGANPVASLLSVNGKFYGTTYNGGMNNAGTVFEITAEGNVTILHSFVSYYDGTNPAASLLHVHGTFYGTTTEGIGEQGSNLGSGTVFRMNSSGTESVLFNFYPPPYGDDGAVPEAALIRVNGKLYGTTAYSGPYSGGTAFNLTPSGDLTILHNFGTGTDGSRSAAPLLDVKGTLYGTTSAGGAYGKGTIFSLTLDGQETVLHDFGYGSDGATPLAGLINVKGTLYGTTSAGGVHGEGTVFALKLY